MILIYFSTRIGSYSTPIGIPARIRPHENLHCPTVRRIRSRHLLPARQAGGARPRARRRLPADPVGAAGGGRCVSVAGGAPPPRPPAGARRLGQEGVDVFLWGGHFPQPVTMSVRVDWDRVHFTCSLRGRSGFAIRGCGREIERVLEEGISCISYTRDCSSQSSYAGSVEYVTVSVRPDLLADWVPDLDLPLGRESDYAPCCDMQRCSPE